MTFLIWLNWFRTLLNDQTNFPGLSSWCLSWVPQNIFFKCCKLKWQVINRTRYRNMYRSWLSFTICCLCATYSNMAPTCTRHVIPVWPPIVMVGKNKQSHVCGPVQYLKHVPHPALGQVEPAPVGLECVHLLHLRGLILSRPDGEHRAMSNCRCQNKTSTTTRRGRGSSGGVQDVIWFSHPGVYRGDSSRKLSPNMTPLAAECRDSHGVGIPVARCHKKAEWKLSAKSAVFDVHFHFLVWDVVDKYVTPSRANHVWLLDIFFRPDLDLRGSRARNE